MSSKSNNLNKISVRKIIDETFCYTFLEKLAIKK